MLEISLYMIGGLLAFFLGLYLTEKGLKRGAGDQLANILKFFTANSFSGMLTGIFVTALIQSSSAVSVMVIGFVSGGVMSLKQGLGVIIGSNIGTTMTIHLFSLKIQYLEWILMGAGFIFILVDRIRKKTFSCRGAICIGFGLIFLGLALLQKGVSPLQYHYQTIHYLQQFGQRPILGILAGTIFTALIQSSSATSGLVLTLARQNMVDLVGAISIILGSNIGTCVTALLAGIGVCKMARRVAYFHVIFNLFGVILFAPMLDGFSLFIGQIAIEPGQQIALAHTLFNLTTGLLFLPFIGYFARILKSK